MRLLQTKKPPQGPASVLHIAGAGAASDNVMDGPDKTGGASKARCCRVPRPDMKLVDPSIPRQTAAPGMRVGQGLLALGDHQMGHPK